jgi:high-affinity Fe2+/Pb2+ permease
MNNNLLLVETELISDSDLFKLYLFVKHAAVGVISKQEYDILEDVRIHTYNKINHLDFYEIINKLYKLYNNEYFKRRKN